MNKATYLLTVLATVLTSMASHATTAGVPPTSVDEPSIFGLLAAGAVVGLLVWRVRNKR